MGGSRGHHCLSEKQQQPVDRKEPRPVPEPWQIHFSEEPGKQIQRQREEQMKPGQWRNQARLTAGQQVGERLVEL